MDEFGDLSIEELRARIARLHEDRDQSAAVFHPAIDAEINRLQNHLVNRLRAQHEDGEDVISGGA